MLLSASPMAWVIDTYNWRIAFLVPVAMAVLVAAAAWLRLGSQRSVSMKSASIRSEFIEVIRIGWSPKLRGVVSLAFVSFAVVIGIRGVWAGPWLMEVRGLSRLETGNFMLALTLMLIVVPMVVGLVDRRTKRTNFLLISGHLLASASLLLLALAGILGLSPLYDLGLLIVFGIAVSVQPLLFALGRNSVSPAHTGKALAAVNLAFFAGAALIQALSAAVVPLGGTAGVIIFLGLLSTLGATFFALL